MLGVAPPRLRACAFAAARCFGFETLAPSLVLAGWGAVLVRAAMPAAPTQLRREGLSPSRASSCECWARSSCGGLHDHGRQDHVNRVPR